MIGMSSQCKKWSAHQNCEWLTFEVFGHDGYSGIIGKEAIYTGSHSFPKPHGTLSCAQSGRSGVQLQQGLGLKRTDMITDGRHVIDLLPDVAVILCINRLPVLQQLQCRMCSMYC